MESIVKDLLEELYILEPTLRNQEKQLTKIITFMVNNVPKSEMNTEFKKRTQKTDTLERTLKKRNKILPIFPNFCVNFSIFISLSILMELFPEYE